MPITIEHEVSPATTGILAHEAGRQARQERDLDRRRQDIEFAAKQQLQYQQLALQAQDQAADRAARVNMAMAQMGAEREGLELQLQNRRDLAEAEWQNRFKIEEMAADARQQMEIQKGVREGVFRYTPAQSRRINQLQDALARVRSDPRYTPEQKAAFAQKVQGELRDLIRNPVPVPPDQRQVAPADQFAAETVDGATINPEWQGVLFFKDDKGNWQILEPKNTIADRQAEQQQQQQQALWKQQENWMAQRQKIQDAKIDLWQKKNEWINKRFETLNASGAANPQEIRQEADELFKRAEVQLDQEDQRLAREQPGRQQAGQVDPQQVQAARQRLSQLKAKAEIRGGLTSDEQDEARQAWEILRNASNR